MITWLGAWAAMYALTLLATAWRVSGPSTIARARAEVGRAVEDLCGDIGVRAVAVQQLTRDRRADFAEFGDAGVEQRLRVFGALDSLVGGDGLEPPTLCV
jgi:hypothetical protein